MTAWAQWPGHRPHLPAARENCTGQADWHVVSDGPGLGKAWLGSGLKHQESNRKAVLFKSAGGMKLGGTEICWRTRAQRRSIVAERKPGRRLWDEAQARKGKVQSRGRSHGQQSKRTGDKWLGVVGSTVEKVLAFYKSQT